MSRSLTLLLTALVVGACASSPTEEAEAPRPAPLIHLVYFALPDDGAKSEAVAELLADCDRLLAPIPAVLSYAAGRPLDTGRASVDDDYDLLLMVRFEDEAGYRAYLGHPDHLTLVDTWKPRLASLRIHDALDETP